MLAAIALLLATLPAMLRGTTGPEGLNVYDAWTYVPADRWLQRHTAYDDLPREALRSDLTLADGWVLTRCGCRVGVISLGAASSELLGTSPDQLHLALLAALFALLPAAIWLLARELRLEPPFAALAAAFGLSPALLMLVGDSVLGNLGGLAIAPLALVIGARAARDGELRHLGLAALLFAGVISIYPEFALPTLAVAALGCAGLLLVARGQAARPTLRAAGIVAGGALLAPIGVERAHHYVTTFFEEFSRGIPRYLTFDDFGSWLFGVEHLYELQRFDDLGVLKTGLAIALPLALAAVIALGVARGGWRAALFVAAPLVVSGGLGTYVYLHYDDCQYCLWKALTFFLPFLGIGLAFGVRAALGGHSPRDLFGSDGSGGILRLAPLAVVAVGLLAIARSDVDLTRATYNSAALTKSDSRGLRDSVAGLPQPARLLLEGTEATAAGAWGPEEAYYIARDTDPRNLAGGRPAVRILFDPRPQTLLPVNPAARFYYSPRYRYVVSTFPGLRSDRRTLANDGIYSLQRRAPIDVALMRTGWAVDPDQGRRATPWLQGPFELWISSPDAARAALRIRLAGPRLTRAGLSFSAGGRRLPARRSGPDVCVEVGLRRGRTVIAVRPDFGRPRPRTFPVNPASGIAISTQIDPRLRPTEADPIPSPPRLLTIRALTAQPGGCGPGG